MNTLGTFLMMGLVMMLGVPDSATPKAPNGSRDRALIEAAGRNDVAMVRRLLKQGASVQAQDGQGRTALLSAVERNHVESVKLLIEAGADVNAQDRLLGVLNNEDVHVQICPG
jgi:uncharacterized protein